jgi:hypothetical protein
MDCVLLVVQRVLSVNFLAYFRMLFNEFPDNARQTIRSITEQPSLKFYCTAEDVILSAANQQFAALYLDALLAMIFEHSKDDLDRRYLQTNFVMLPDDVLNCTAIWTFSDIADGLVALGSSMHLYREPLKLVVLHAYDPSNISNGQHSTGASAPSVD